jgi:nucleoside phosphorylase
MNVDRWLAEVVGLHPDEDGLVSLDASMIATLADQLDVDGRELAVTVRFLIGVHGKQGSAFEIRTNTWRVNLLPNVAKIVIVGAITAAALQHLGVEGVPAAVLSVVGPLLLAIERVDIDASDLVLHARLADVAAQGTRGIAELYRSLPPDAQAELTLSEFAEIVQRLHRAGLARWDASGVTLISPGRRRGFKLLLREPTAAEVTSQLAVADQAPKDLHDGGPPGKLPLASAHGGKGSESPAPALDAPLVGLVTALPEEFAAVRLMADPAGSQEFPGDPNVYLRATVPTQRGDLSVVIAQVIKPGNNSADGLATALLLHYETVRDVIMVGIAAGIPCPERPDGHVRLGDIVVGTRGVLQYDNVRRVAGLADTPREPPAAPSAYLLARVRNLAADAYAGLRPWETHLHRMGADPIWARPSARTDTLVASDGRSRVRHPRDPQRRPGLPRVHQGMIGSANVLLRDPQYRDQLRDRYGLRAVEMEGSGIADATWTHACGHLVVRGICDYADQHKGDTWHHYAALAAAAYVRALLERYDPRRDFKPSASTPTGLGPSPGWRAPPGTAKGGARSSKRRADDDPTLATAPGLASSAREAPPAAQGEQALQELRLLSAAAAADADVVSVAGGPAGGIVRLSGGLYVPRDVEDEVVALATSHPVAVVGEAGHGKTSLLWHLHRRCSAQQDQEVFLIKAPALADFGPTISNRDEGAGSIHTETLLRAVLAAQHLDRQPLVLLDTVDLLLHSDASRVSVAGIVKRLVDAGAQLVLTCRPQEARILLDTDLLSGVTLRTRPLAGYSDHELRRAVAVHASVYSTNLPGRWQRPAADTPRPGGQADDRQDTRGDGWVDDPEQRAATILDAVARGLPLREVCQNPLTLRLLFELYVGQRIPPEIDTAELYQTYWDRRVRTDQRSELAGGTRGPDLSLVAEAVGLVLLAEGSPELPKRLVNEQADQLLIHGEHAQKLRGAVPDGADVLDGLVRRGVLLRSPPPAATVRYFHQTFFEFAAAHALLTWRGARGLDFVVDRTIELPDDLFLGAVTEQALSLAGRADAAIRLRAEARLAGCLTCDHLNVVTLALSAYAQQPRPSAALQDAARSALASAPAPAVNRFLDVQPAIAAAAADRVLADLKAVWERDNRALRHRVLAALTRLAAREPAMAARFLIDHGVIDWLLTDPPDQLRTHHWLVHSLDILLTALGHRAWKHVIKAWETLATNVSSRLPIVELLEVIDRHAAALQPATLPTRLAPAVAALERERKQDSAAVQKAFGPLWLHQWQADSRGLEVPVRQTLDELLTTTDDIEHDIVAMSKLYALGAAIQRLPAPAAGPCLDAVLACQRRGAQRALSRSLLPTLLTGPPTRTAGAAAVPADAAAAAGDPGIPPATAALRAAVARLLAGLPDHVPPPPRGGESWPHIIRDAIHKSALSPPEVAGVLSTVHPAPSAPPKPDPTAALDPMTGAGGAARPAAARARRRGSGLRTGDAVLDLWLREDGLAVLVVAAARGGHPDAARALRYWRDHPELVRSPAAQTARKLIGSSWQSAAATDPAAFPALLADATALRDVTWLYAAVRAHPDQAVAGLSGQQQQLAGLLEVLLRSRRAEDARTAARFWRELLQRRLLRPPSPRLLLDQLTAHTELRALAALVTLLGSCAPSWTEAATEPRPAGSAGSAAGAPADPTGPDGGMTLGRCGLGVSDFEPVLSSLLNRARGLSDPATAADRTQQPAASHYGGRPPTGAVWKPRELGTAMAATLAAETRSALLALLVFAGPLDRPPPGDEPPHYPVESRETVTDEAVRIALEPPSDSGLVALLGRLVTRLVDHGWPADAADVLRTVARRAPAAGVASHGMSVVANRLRRPLREALSALVSLDREQLLVDLVEADADMGRVAVEEACKAAFFSLEDTLRRLSEDPRTPAEIKDVIRINRRQRQRTLGGVPWPELLADVIS